MGAMLMPTLTEIKIAKLIAFRAGIGAAIVLRTIICLIVHGKAKLAQRAER
jgi:hypothetical protein